MDSQDKVLKVKQALLKKKNQVLVFCCNKRGPAWVDLWVQDEEGIPRRFLIKVSPELGIEKCKRVTVKRVRVKVKVKKHKF